MMRRIASTLFVASLLQSVVYVASVPDLPRCAHFNCAWADNVVNGEIEKENQKTFYRAKK